MAYDVLLVAAIKDSDKATVIARRLRALKFRVRFDASRAHTTPSSRDLGDCNKAANVLVLWSKASCNTSRPDSDWVHAMAHLARSRDGALVQASLDETVPDDPFEQDRRYDLAGLTARKTPEGFYRLVEQIGQRDGRRDLRAWMMLSASDEAGKAEWKEAHPADPLSQTGKRGAAAAEPEEASETPKPKASRKKEKSPKTSAPTGIAASAAATAKIADASAGHKISLNPPVPERDFYQHTSSGGGKAMMVFVLLGVAAMMAGALFVRTVPMQAGTQQAGPIEVTTAMQSCPAGQVPRSLVHGSLLGELEAGSPEDD